MIAFDRPRFTHRFARNSPKTVFLHFLSTTTSLLSSSSSPHNEERRAVDLLELVFVFLRITSGRFLEIESGNHVSSIPYRVQRFLPERSDSLSLSSWLVSGGRLRAFTGNHVHELISPVHAWWRPTSNRDAQKRAEKSLCPLSFCFPRSTTDKVFPFYREEREEKKREKSLLFVRDIFFFFFFLHFHRYFRRRKLSIIRRVKRISNGGQKTTLSLSLIPVHVLSVYLFARSAKYALNGDAH